MNKTIGCVIAYNDNHNNYGTSLQGYAMLKKIQDLGYSCEVIRYIKKLSYKQKIQYIINAIRAGETKNIIARITKKNNLRKHPQYAEGIKRRTKVVNKYKEIKIIPYFHKFIGFQALQEGTKIYDAIVVGSDQVWSPLSLPNKFFNLLFVDENMPKIAYASSFGVSEIPTFQKKATGKYLDRFQVIGVREQRGKEIVESLSHKKAQVVADPTLLLDRKEWEKEIRESKKRETQPFIFCYFLGNNPNARKAANELKEKTGYKIITIRHMDEYVPEDEFFGDEAPYDIDPNDFIALISQATYVCTDSFHCTVFSIIFEKQFMTFYRFAIGSKTARNSRIDSLFSVLGINRERIYSNEICETINHKIDYTSVNQRLSQLREESIKFLTNALKYKS